MDSAHNHSGCTSSLPQGSGGEMRPQIQTTCPELPRSGHCGNHLGIAPWSRCSVCRTRGAVYRYSQGRRNHRRQGRVHRASRRLPYNHRPDRLQTLRLGGRIRRPRSPDNRHNRPRQPDGGSGRQRRQIRAQQSLQRLVDRHHPDRRQTLRPSDRIRRRRRPDHGHNKPLQPDGSRCHRRRRRLPDT